MKRPSPQLRRLLADCSPAVANLALAVRELVLTEVPEAEEVLFSVYAQVIVFKLSGRKRGAFCNLAAYPKHVNLVFYYGALLPDPHGLLEGRGKQMRHIPFRSPDDLRRAREVRACIRSALQLVEPAPR